MGIGGAGGRCCHAGARGRRLCSARHGRAGDRRERRFDHRCSERRPGRKPDACDGRLPPDMRTRHHHRQPADAGVEPGLRPDRRRHRRRCSRHLHGLLGRLAGRVVARRRVLDASLLVDAVGFMLRSRWNTVRPFVERLRRVRGNEYLFENFEWLAIYSSWWKDVPRPRGDRNYDPAQFAGVSFKV